MYVCEISLHVDALVYNVGILYVYERGFSTC